MRPIADRRAGKPGSLAGRMPAATLCRVAVPTDCGCGPKVGAALRLMKRSLSVVRSRHSPALPVPMRSPLIPAQLVEARRVGGGVGHDVLVVHDAGESDTGC